MNEREGRFLLSRVFAHSCDLPLAALQEHPQHRRLDRLKTDRACRLIVARSTAHGSKPSYADAVAAAVSGVRPRMRSDAFSAIIIVEL